MPKRKNLLYILFASVSAALLYIILSRISPNQAIRLPAFIFLVVIETIFYLYNKPFFFSRSKIGGWIISLLYWLPLLLIIVFVITSFFEHFVFWNRIFSIYLVGLIFVLYTSKLLPLIFFGADRLFYGIKWLSMRKHDSNKGEQKISRRSFLQKMGWASGGILLSSFVYGMARGVYNFKIHQIPFYSKKIPEAFNGLKIVQLSDMHLGSWVSINKLKEVVEMINALQADIFVFTGDLVDYRTDEAYPFAEILQQIKVRLGKFSVLGNHDYGEYFPWDNQEDKMQDHENMISFHQSVGWDLLLNESRVINIRGQEIQLTGVENWGDRGRFTKRGDLEKAMKNVRDVPFRILLSHDPSHWEYHTLNFPELFDLTLAGHTHGGQFGIEWGAMKWSIVQVAYKRWAGMFEENNSISGEKQYLYVNRGIGTIGFPGRVGIQPEITLIELKKV